MSKKFTLRSGIVAMSLLAISGFAAAADQAPDSPQANKMAHHRQFDPVAHTQRLLDNLENKLSLTDSQKPAWQAYADNALARARERATRMQEWRSSREGGRADGDMADRLDKMSQAMRQRADDLQKVAQDTRTFEQALTSEQKTIFNLFWKAQSHHRMGHRSPA
jgi:hypothetical protein